jgi:hypothetical protein
LVFYLLSIGLGLYPTLKQSLLPVLIVAAIAYISKICLEASAPVHTAVVVIICAGVLRLFNPISFLLTLIGSLLTFIVFGFGLPGLCQTGLYGSFKIQRAPMVAFRSAETGPSNIGFDYSKNQQILLDKIL